MKNIIVVLVFFSMSFSLSGQEEYSFTVRGEIKYEESKIEDGYIHAYDFKKSDGISKYLLYVIRNDEDCTPQKAQKQREYQLLEKSNEEFGSVIKGEVEVNNGESPFKVLELGFEKDENIGGFYYSKFTSEKSYRVLLIYHKGQINKMEVLDDYKSILTSFQIH